MHQRLRTLEQLAIGQRGVIRHIDCDRRTGCRLMEMGLLPGTPIEMVRRSPLGDPLKIRLRGYLLSLRKSEASSIYLASDGEPESVLSEVTVLPCSERKTVVQGTVSQGTENRGVSPRVVVAGNANAGKTTIFNALTGSRAQIGNYPGVTVTRSSRVIQLPDQTEAEIVDLPGTYSLSSHSPDEHVAVDEIFGRQQKQTMPATAVVVVDACALERGLYLALQIIETGVPVVIALNMIDEAEASGFAVDPDKLASWLGVSVVPMVASKGTGLEELRQAITVTIRQAPQEAVTQGYFSKAVEQAVEEIEQSFDKTSYIDTPAVRRSWAMWSLLSYDTDDEEVTKTLPVSTRQTIEAVRERARGAEINLDYDVIAARYHLIERVVGDARQVVREVGRSWTDRIDSILTDRVYGVLVFAVVMWMLFESIFSWSDPFIGMIEDATAAFQRMAIALLPIGPLQDLVVNGVIAGVGNVVVFVPQIALLFVFIAFLEDLGYLARVAFIIDRLMGQIGLHGKAFVPMLSGFACAIPAVMATRTIESRRDRLITMLTLPMVSCSARLPVYALVTAVVFAGEPRLFGLFSVGAVVLFVMYALSVCATLGAATVLRRTVLDGPRLPLVLELPPYRVPVWSNVLLVTWRRVRKFLVDAGTIILTMTIILWALLSYPNDPEISLRYEALRAETVSAIADPVGRAEALELLDGQEAGAELRYSFAGRVGLFIEPATEPLGLDWRIGVGILGAFAAREVFVSTLGIVFGIADADEENASLRELLREATWEDGRPLMTPLSGVSLMIFFVLACQCMSTVSVVRREAGNWGWPMFMFVYMTFLAYGASLFVYQVGSLLGWGLA